MPRLASMIAPAAFAVAVLTAGAACAGEYYERVGADSYRPARGAWYSSTCCYKKVIKHITITKSVWIKVPPPSPPPRPHRHHHEDDEGVDRPAIEGHEHGARPRHRVVELGEVIRSGDRCRKPVAVKDGGTTIIVMINVRCR